MTTNLAYPEGFVIMLGDVHNDIRKTSPCAWGIVPKDKPNKALPASCHKAETFLHGDMGFTWYVAFAAHVNAPEQKAYILKPLILGYHEAIKKRVFWESLRTLNRWTHYSDVGLELYIDFSEIDRAVFDRWCTLWGKDNGVPKDG